MRTTLNQLPAMVASPVWPGSGAIGSDAMAEPQGCVCFTLRKSARAIARLYDDALKPCGLRNTQFALLGALEILGDATVGHLAEELAMDRTTLTRNLQVLVRDGMIENVVSVDARKRVVRLTKAGARRYGEALPLWSAVQHQVLCGLEPDRWRRLVNDLGKVEEISRPR